MVSEIVNFDLEMNLLFVIHGLQNNVSNNMLIIFLLKLYNRFYTSKIYNHNISV